jgi:beta-lactamase superfamily II metal-dependent hydrolase
VQRGFQASGKNPRIAVLCKITPESSRLTRYEDRCTLFRVHPITYLMTTRKYLLAPLLLVLILLSPSCAELELLTGSSRGGPGPPPSGSLSVSFIDVGQGDAVLVQAGGESYLIDAGRPEEGPNVVDFLRSRSVDSLDGIVVTNPPIS